MTRLNPLLLLSLLGCRGDAETGIDRTFIRGSVELTPGAFTEAESAKGVNDTYDVAEDIGYIGSRYTTVSGSCALFDQSNTPNGATPSGDFDAYQLSPLADTTLTFALVYADADLEGADTGDVPSEVVTWHMAVYDVDDLTYTYETDPKTKKEVLTSIEPALVTEATSEGSYGNFVLSADVTAGTNYVVVVAGMENNGDSDAYELQIDGLDPNEQKFMIGAYQGSTFAEKGNPVGGSDIPTLTLNEETLTWEGDYEITYVYGSTECPRGDTECTDAASPTSVYEYDQEETEDTGTAFPTIAIKADIAEVYLFAGNFASLNAGLTAGTLYSSSPVTVSMNAAIDEDLTDGFIGTNSTNRGITADTIACDTIQPKLYGWSEAAVEPNNFDDVGDGYTVSGTGAQVLPEATGAGYVDVITGTFNYDGTGDWSGEHDAFALTVPETLDAYMVAAWGDPNTNLDFHFYDGTGEIWAAGWTTADVNPEALLVSEAGLYLEAGETYYIALLPWSGSAGSFDYTIEIEWLAP
ncbi:MAG: hypothetical protein P8R54_17475 [Myxococcota bacterium]|nr:hypothetical protein [Myxococcota bacterium]